MSKKEKFESVHKYPLCIYDTKLVKKKKGKKCNEINSVPSRSNATDEKLIESNKRNQESRNGK